MGEPGPEIHVGAPPEVLAWRGIFGRVQVRLLAQGLRVERSYGVFGLTFTTRSKVLAFSDLKAVQALEVGSMTWLGTLLVGLGGFLGTWMAQDFFRSLDVVFLGIGVVAVGSGFGADALLQRIRRVELRIEPKTGRAQRFVGQDFSEATRLAAILKTVLDSDNAS